MNKEVEKIVLMYHKSLYGKAKDVQEAARDFSAYMLELYEKLQKETK